MCNNYLKASDLQISFETNIFRKSALYKIYLYNQKSPEYQICGMARFALRNKYRWKQIRLTQANKKVALEFVSYQIINIRQRKILWWAKQKQKNNRK